MKAFRFPLEHALHWRRTQLEMERATLGRLQQQREQLETTLATLDQVRIEMQQGFAGTAWISAAELQTVNAYQGRIKQEKTTQQSKLEALARETAAQLEKTTKAQQQVKLLERLRSRCLQVWTEERNAEQERFAAEAWLSRLIAGTNETNT